MKRMNMKCRAGIMISLSLIFMNPAKPQEISPNLVGVNAWYTNPSEQVWNLTAESGVKTIRIGGHAFDDNLPSKSSLLSWVKKIQAMGAEPIIQVSQYQPASAAADLVRYFNIEMSGEVNPVKYWNIGNEPWLQYNNLAGGTDVGTLVETYFKPISAAMKEVDPTIKIYGPDFCYYVEFAINDLFGGKNDIAGKIPGMDYYYCDGISWHRYPQNENINLAYGGIEDFRGSIVKCKQKVDEVNASHNRTGDDALIWGIGEFNAKHGALVHTWENGQMFCGILGLCMKYEAKYAASWSMFENSGSRQGTDFSFIDGANMTPRASYRHMEFVAKYFKGNYIDGTSSSNDFVVYGAQNEEQTTVMIMYRADGGPKEYHLLLNDTATTPETYRLKVDAELDLSYKDMITPRTTQVLIFRGDSIIKFNYSSEDFGNERPPSQSYFKLPDSLPADPDGLLADPVSFNRIELSWNDNSDNEQGFILERQGSGEFEIITVLPPNTINYSDSDLSPETSYTYRIQAYNSLGKSDYTEPIPATTQLTPSAIAFNGPHSIPGRIQAEDFNDNEAGIGYSDSDDINEGGAYRSTGVDIESSTEGGYNIGYVSDGEWLSYLVENVSPGSYDVAFRVASNNSTSTKRIDVFFDDLFVGNVIPVYTRGWQTWETVYLKNVEISTPDPFLLTLKFSGESFNLNWIEFTKSIGLSYGKELKPNGPFARQNVHAKTISIILDSPFEKANLQISNLKGQVFYNSACQHQEKKVISTENWDRGIYFITLINKDDCMTQKLILR